MMLSGIDEHLVQFSSHFLFLSEFIFHEGDIDNQATANSPTQTCSYSL